MKRPAADMKRAHHAQSLYRLIFCSQRAPTAEGGTEPADGIGVDFADAARQRNQAAQVTAVLLCTGAHYAQVMEGTRDALDRSFERIARDPRHTEVTVLSFAPTERRRFPDAAMTVIAARDDSYRELFNGLKPDPARDRPRLTTGSDILRLLERLTQTATESAGAL